MKCIELLEPRNDDIRILRDIEQHWPQFMLANLAMVDLCHWGWREMPTHITDFSSLQHCNTRPRSHHVLSLENSESPTVRFYSTQIDEMPMNVADLI